MLGIHPEAQGMALMQSSPLEAARCTLALTFKGVHNSADGFLASRRKLHASYGESRVILLQLLCQNALPS